MQYQAIWQNWLMTESLLGIENLTKNIFLIKARYIGLFLPDGGNYYVCKMLFGIQEKGIR